MRTEEATPGRGRKGQSCGCLRGTAPPLTTCWDSSGRDWWPAGTLDTCPVDYGVVTMGEGQTFKETVVGKTNEWKESRKKGKKNRETSGNVQANLERRGSRGTASCRRPAEYKLHCIHLTPIATEMLA